MDRKELKNTILNVCLQTHKRSAETLLAEMTEAYQNAHDYGTPEDWFDTYKMDMLNKRDAYAIQLQKTLEEIKTLEKIDSSKIYDKVTFGAVVITNSQKFFVSLGLGKIKVENDTFYAISPSVPIYHAMQGMKAGDTFQFRDAVIKILDVF